MLSSRRTSSRAERRVEEVVGGGGEGAWAIPGSLEVRSGVNVERGRRDGSRPTRLCRRQRRLVLDIPRGP